MLYHLNCICSNKIRKFINEKSAVIIYKSMILPYFDYCDVTYMFSKACELDKLNRLHKRGMKISLKNGYNLNENELFNMCKLSDLDIRRHVHLRNYMFNNRSKYIKEKHIVNTRLHDGPVFEIPKPNNDIIKKSVIYSGALDWNSLDTDTRNIKELFQFKRLQKAWMAGTYVN